MRSHRVAQPRAELLDEFRLVAEAQLVLAGGAWARKSLDRDLAVLPDEHVAGRELPDVAKDRVRSRDRVEGEERLERIQIDLAARQRPQLRREAQLSVDVPVVERLDPVGVTGEHETTTARVPDGGREHPAQALGEAGPVLLVEVDERFRVAARPQLVARTLELAAQ